MCFVWQFICWLASKFLLRLILLSWVFTLPTHQLWLCIFSLFPQFYTSFVISPFSACSTPPPSPSGRVCDCLSSFPSCLCPLSLSVALLPNWLCNPEWISVSCCAWLNQCVFVCVCGCRLLVILDWHQSFCFGIQKLIAAPSLHYCTCPSSPTSHPSSSLPWYLLYDLSSCNGPSLLLLVIFCVPLHQCWLWSVSRLTLYLTN